MSQLPLIVTGKPNKRPTQLTAEQYHRVANLIASDLISECDFTARDRKGIVADLIKYAPRKNDGYEIAKELDDYCGWTPDSGMVEILDLWPCYCSNELAAAEKQWFADNPHEPPFPPGTRVTFGWQCKTGTITGVSSYGAAKFLIQVDGEDASTKRVVNFEDVTRL